MRKQEAVRMATQDSPTFYERLGGVYSIATVVDDLIDRVMADPRLNANPLVDDAHHKGRQASNTWLPRCCAGPPEVRRNTPARTWRARTGTCASRRASGTRSWTTWCRRLTSSQSRPPSGPRSWPSSRAHGLTSSSKGAAEGV